VKIVFQLDSRQLIKSLEQFERMFIDFLAEELDAVGFKIVADAVKLCPHGFGNLASTISHKVVVEDVSVYLIVGASALYAAAVENGSRPHWPPWSAKNPEAAPLRAWAKRYLGDEDLAYVVARKISKEGTKAQPFIGPAFEANIPLFKKAIDKAEQRTLAKMGM
jgi:hypothetical protein